jgi:hypothetical protein
MTDVEINEDKFPMNKHNVKRYELEEIQRQKHSY